MSYQIALITLILLILLIVYQIKVWRLRVLLSPALYFAAFWVIGDIGCIVMVPSGILYTPYPEYINELNILVGFSAVSFLLLTKYGRNKIIETPILLNFLSMYVFKILTFLLLTAAIYQFISLGGNLNMGLARENSYEIQASQALLVGYAKTMAIPLSIFAGHKIVSNLITTGKIGGWVLLVPLVANIIFSINLGGRIDAFFSFIAYLIGATFALSLNHRLSRYKKIITYLVVGVILMMTFINGVSSQRSTYQRGTVSDIEIYLNDNYPILSMLNGPIAYCSSTYQGYQVRRVDAVDLNNLGYGKFTFNGFINWTLPFSNLIGLGDFSIAKELDLYYNSLETYDFERDLYNYTHSSYLTIIKDFGFYGSFLCIFLLCWISHYLFIKVQKKSIISYAIFMFLYYIFWNYWSRSVFYGTLSPSVLVPLYGFLIIDIFKFIIYKKMN